MIRTDHHLLREKELDTKERARVLAIFHRHMRIIQEKTRVTPATTSLQYSVFMDFKLSDRAVVKDWFSFSPSVGGTILTKFRKLFGMICSQYGYKYVGFGVCIESDILQLTIVMEKKIAKNKRYIPGLYKRA